MGKGGGGGDRTGERLRGKGVTPSNLKVYQNERLQKLLMGKRYQMSTKVSGPSKVLCKTLFPSTFSPFEMER